MTVEEKRDRIARYCDSCKQCADCPLCGTEGRCYHSGVSNGEIIRNYYILFSDKENNEAEDPEKNAPEYPEDSVEPAEDPVNRPSHYTDGKIEVIDYIEDKKLGFCLGNAIKYISRAGKKDPSKEIEDLRKAKWYIERRIKELEEASV